MDQRKQLCVVFDIDETLIQFVSNTYKPIWDNLNDEIKSKFSTTTDSKGHLIILRPHIRDLFNYFKSKPEIKVGLWTYSEREYSKHISEILSNVLELPPDFFMFTWGAEDMDEELDGYESTGNAKDLTRIYHMFPNFNTFNTFIVDDLYKNIKHDTNINNSIIIEPFAPLGTSKVRVDIGAEKQTKLSQDLAFVELKQICEKSLADILGCDLDDIDEAFKTESLFSAKRVKRMGLDNYRKTYAIQFIHMMTIGAPMQKNDFILVNQNYGHHVKGGTKRRRRKNLYVKGKHSRKHSRKYKKIK